MTENDTQELRERIEDVLLGWSTSNGVVLSTDSKHSLLYGAIPEVLALIHQREQAARIDEIELWRDAGFLFLDDATDRLATLQATKPEKEG